MRNECGLWIDGADRAHQLGLIGTNADRRGTAQLRDEAAYSQSHRRPKSWSGDIRSEQFAAVHTQLTEPAKIEVDVACSICQAINQIC